MLLSVRISTASFMLLICLTWWVFHVFFHTWIIFSIKETEIHSPVLYQTRLWMRDSGTPGWKAAMPSHMLFLHQRNVTCTSDEAHLVSLWWLLRLPEPWLKPTSRLLLQSAAQTAACLHPSSLDGDCWMSFSSSASAQASSTCFCQCQVHVPCILLSLA